jgi:hypothetical protein
MAGARAMAFVALCALAAFPVAVTGGEEFRFFLSFQRLFL